MPAQRASLRAVLVAFCPLPLFRAAGGEREDAQGTEHRWQGGQVKVRKDLVGPIREKPFGAQIVGRLICPHAVIGWFGLFRGLVELGLTNDRLVSRQCCRVVVMVVVVGCCWKDSLSSLFCGL